VCSSDLVWLDYEDSLSTEILQDVRSVATRALSGTLIAISVPCKRAAEIQSAHDDGTPSAIDRFRDVFGPERVRSSVTELDLEGWPFGILSRAMLKMEIRAALAVRNATATRNERLTFKPICNLEYNDGTKMTTLVGVITSANDIKKFNECGFGSLDFLPRRGRRVRINVPKLTVREARWLERQLPLLADGKINRGPIPASEARPFAHLYRYLPNFAVLES